MSILLQYVFDNISENIVREIEANIILSFLFRDLLSDTPYDIRKSYYLQVIKLVPNFFLKIFVNG